MSKRIVRAVNTFLALSVKGFDMSALVMMSPSHDKMHVSCVRSVMERIWMDMRRVVICLHGHVWAPYLMERGGEGRWQEDGG